MYTNYLEGIDNYICDRYYRVIYKHGCDVEHEAKGFLLNYCGGNIVLLSDVGIYHVLYKNIVLMEPVKPKPDRWSKEFQELVLNNPYLNSVVNSEIVKNSDSSDSKERYRSDAEREMEKTINEYADKFFGKAREARGGRK